MGVLFFFSKKNRSLRKASLAVHIQVESCADFSKLAWLAEIGYKRFLLCNELCLHKDLLNTAINAFRAFEHAYT